MSPSTASVEITIAQPADAVFSLLCDLRRLPEWYEPAQAIEILTPGPVQVDWQFVLTVQTLGGISLKALGTVTTYQPENRLVIWHGQTMGIQGDSRWQVLADGPQARVQHSFTGRGWMLWLSNKLDRHESTLMARLENLKRLSEQ